MNWSRTKSIFIITFLILNLFLSYQLYVKQKTAARAPDTSGKVSLLESLKNNHISLPEGGLPEATHASYIKGELKTFTKEEVKRLETGEGDKKKTIQTINVTADKITLLSTLVQPIQIQRQTARAQFEKFLSTYVYRGEEYVFWKPTEDGLLFVQKYQGKAVFPKSETSLLKVNINDGRITGYQQSYMILETYKEKKEIFPAIDALDSLYGYLTFGSSIVVFKLAYFNLIEEPVEEGRIFVPTWHVVVKEDDGSYHEYFVNAMNNQVQTVDERNNEEME